MFEDFSGKRVFWTKHAAKEVLEDNIDTKKVEATLNKTYTMESGLGKEKGVVKTGEGYITLIFVRYNRGLKIVTCWRSSGWEIKVYEEAVK